MDKKPEKPLRKPDALSLDLVALYDEFAELQDVSSFFCEAMTALLANEAEGDASIVEGARSFSSHLQAKSQALKEQFKDVCERDLSGVDNEGPMIN